MNKLPIVSGKRLIRALTRKGYLIIKKRKGKKGKGNHVFIAHPKDPTRTTVIQDTSDDLEPWLISAIRRQLKLSREEFIEILRDC